MNRGTIRTQSANFCEDPNQTRFAGKYNDAINRAQEQFAFDSKALFKDASAYTVVDGTASYALPADFMYEKKITHKGLLLDPISRATLEYYETSDRWDDDSGTPKYYLIDPEEARKTITLYPIPQAADAGANLILTYCPLPAEMTADGDTPLNSSLLMAQFHVGISAYAAWLLLNYAPTTPENQAKKTDLLRIYESSVTKAIDTFKNTASEPLRMKGGRYF